MSLTLIRATWHHSTLDPGAESSNTVCTGGVPVIHAGVDQRLRSPGADFRRIEAWIEERAPGLAQNVDRLRRPRPRRHRPQHLMHVAWIDVVVDDDHILSEIGAADALRGECHDLRRVAGIHLLDRDHGDAPAGGFRDRPDTLNAG